MTTVSALSPTAGSPQKGAATNGSTLTSPSRADNNKISNNSSQMNGVFGRCAEPVPQNIASVRQQQQASLRQKSASLETGLRFACDDGYSGNKTVDHAKPNPIFKKKAGSIPIAEVNIFSGPDANSTHRVRTTQQHTDPFSEFRVRDNGHKRKNLVPESTLKAQKTQSVRVSNNSKARYDTPFASDPTADINGVSSNKNSPSPLSPEVRIRTDGASPAHMGKRCPQKRDSDIFGSVSTPTDDGSESPSYNGQNGLSHSPSNSRFKFSQQGDTTMFSELTAADLAKQTVVHKKGNPKAQRQSMEGVFSPLERKNRHPNYKFHAPFARQGSVAATVKVNGRRHTHHSDAAMRGEVVTPFAAPLSESTSPAPAEFSTSSRSRKVFSDKHSSKTPFARISSLPPSKNANYARRVFKQAATFPFAVDQ